MHASDNYPLQHTAPGVEEYCELRALSGMSSKTREAAARGLPNTLFAATIRDGGTLIAMGRVLGDGGCHFHIVDVAVHPGYQRRGLGTRIMDCLMTSIRTHAPPSAYVSLIADDHSPALYRKFGFQPTAPKSIGMALRIRAG